MGQTAGDIVARAAYEVSDEHYEVIRKEHLIRDLDRVYREYCKDTKILTGKLGIILPAVAELDLLGQTETGERFGDNFLKLFRAEYTVGSTVKRANEIDFEDVMNLRINNSTNPTDDNVKFAIRYFQKSKRLYFPFTASAGDKFIFWFYKVPTIGTITKVSDTFEIDDKHTDNLVVGLAMKACKQFVTHYGKTKEWEMVKFYSGMYTEMRDSWNMLKIESGKEALSYKEDDSPIIAQIPSVLNLDDDDYSGTINV